MPDDIPHIGLSAHIEGLCQRFNVVVQRTALDDWADVVTRISGDEVVQDPVFDKLVALKRAGHIDPRQMATLVIRYLREKKTKNPNS